MCDQSHGFRRCRLWLSKDMFCSSVYGEICSQLRGYLRGPPGRDGETVAVSTNACLDTCIPQGLSQQPSNYGRPRIMEESTMCAWSWRVDGDTNGECWKPVRSENRSSLQLLRRVHGHILSPSEDWMLQCNTDWDKEYACRRAGWKRHEGLHRCLTQRVQPHKVKLQHCHTVPNTDPS